MKNDMILKAGGTVFNFVRKNLPTILSWTAAGGVVATAVTSAQASKKAEKDKLRYAIQNQIYVEEMEPVEVVAVTWKDYILPTVVAGTTIFCTLKSNAINQERQRALAASYIILRERFDKYVRKIKERYGEETHQRIMNELAIEQAQPPFISCESFMKGTSTSVDLDDEVQRVFYDATSGKLFTSTMTKVLEAEYHLNRNMSLGKFVTMQDWYDFLGIEATDNCPPWQMNATSLASVGWEICDSFQWLDFDHEKQIMEIPTEDGHTALEAIIINIGFEPMPESYYDY